jgi:hypothetical protein
MSDRLLNVDFTYRMPFPQIVFGEPDEALEAGAQNVTGDVSRILSDYLVYNLLDSVFPIPFPKVQFGEPSYNLQQESFYVAGAIYDQVAISLAASFGGIGGTVRNVNNPAGGGQVGPTIFEIPFPRVTFGAPTPALDAAVYDVVAGIERSLYQGFETSFVGGVTQVVPFPDIVFGPPDEGLAIEVQALEQTIFGVINDTLQDEATGALVLPKLDSSQALAQIGTDAVLLAKGLRDGFNEALDTFSVGGLVASSWNKDFAENQRMFQQMGVGVGTTFVEAFVQAVVLGAGNVRQRMAELIAPEVATIIGRSQPVTPLP